MKAFVRITVAVTVGTAAAAQAAGGLSVPESTWPRWQARLSVGTDSPATAPSAGYVPSRLVAASLLGDYYFLDKRLVPALSSGGFRATSGVILGAGAGWLGALGIPNRVGDRVSFGHQALATAVPSADASDGVATLPYVGFGYTSLSVTRGIGFSADLGLIAQNPGRAPFGPQQNLDDAIRNLRLMPVVQLGVRYTF